MANWQVDWQLWLGYTAKGHQYQAAGGRPVFCFLGGLPRSSWFFLSSFSLGRWASCLVRRACRRRPRRRVQNPGQTIVLPAVAGSAYCVCPGEARRFTSRARLGTWYFLGLRPSKSRSAAPTSEAARGRAMGLLTRRAWVPAFCDGAAISKLVQYNCSRRTSTE